MQECRGRAKVNLCLNVTGKKDGFHLLDGVYVSLSLFDTVRLQRNGSDFCRVSYTDGRTYANDSARTACELLQKTFHTEGFDVLIEKRIPERMGLGGSSADAAAVVQAFTKEFSYSVDRAMLLRMGSDVPFQVQGGCAEVRGCGEKIDKLSLPKLFCCLLLPREGVSTSACFRLYDEIGGEEVDVKGCIASLQKKEPVDYGNALVRSACRLNGKVAEGLRILRQAGFSCGMTGSGSALFGTEYDETSFFEKRKKVVAGEDFTVLTVTTEE